MIGRTNAAGKSSIAGVFPITTTVVNGTSSGATITASGNTAIVLISAGQDYRLPTSITVSGASYTYDSGTGTITLTNPTAPVSINATCVPLSPAIYVEVYYSNFLGGLSYPVKIYDGQNDSGTLVGDMEPNDVDTYAIRSGYIYVDSPDGEDPMFCTDDSEKLSNPYPVTENTTLYIESDSVLG